MIQMVNFFIDYLLVKLWNVLLSSISSDSVNENLAKHN